jgi:hypothetical protein
MPRFSTTLDADQFEWVKDEAQRRGRSQADIVRLCIDAVRTGSVNIDEHPTQPVRTEPVADLRDRVAELEKRVDDLEGGDESSELNQQTGSDHADALVKTDSPEIEGRETPSSRSNPHTQTVAKAVAYAREHQPVSRAEILDAVGDEVDIRGDSLWKRHIRDALKEDGFEYDRAGGVATWSQNG